MMRLLHFLEIENFKRFKSKQRVNLDHPAVIIGPNNCGKTTALQAIALWSQAVKTWYEKKGESPPKERPSAALNRLSIVSVPVQRTRYFWHNASVRTGNHDIPLNITLGIQYEGKVVPVTMQFRNQGDELVYCIPDEKTLEKPGLIKAAAELKVELLYPMSGLETDEPVLQPGRIDVLLGQGQTAQVLRNLCLLVYRESQEDWKRIKDLMERLFMIELGDPVDNPRGSIDLFYQQEKMREQLDITAAGRGLQQMLLIFAYLYTHRGSVLLVDEPDAHLEILRQKQIYALLTEMATRNDSQVILVTHSEVILGEAIDRNLTLLLGGQTHNLAGTRKIRNALKHYGTENYIRARQRGHVLYVEGKTDFDILKALAEQLNHPVVDVWDMRSNTFYVQDNYPGPQDPEAQSGDLGVQLERVEGGFGITPKRHFFGLRDLIPELKGLAILDHDNKEREDFEEGGLKIVHWKRYEIENYFITPDLLKRFTMDHYSDMGLFIAPGKIPDDILDKLTCEYIFEGNEKDFLTWQEAPRDAAKLLWEARSEKVKLSDYAEEYFRRLGDELGSGMIFTKSDLYRLVPFVEPVEISNEVAEKLDLLQTLFEAANPEDEI